jgi:hypothetical protein
MRHNWVQLAYLADCRQLLMERQSHVVALLLLLLCCLLQGCHISSQLSHAALLQHLLREDG